MKLGARPQGATDAKGKGSRPTRSWQAIGRPAWLRGRSPCASLTSTFRRKLGWHPTANRLCTALGEWETPCLVASGPFRVGNEIASARRSTGRKAPPARTAVTSPRMRPSEFRSDLVDDQPVANGIQPARPRPRPMIDGAHAPKSWRALRLQMIEAGERAVLDQETQRHLRVEPQCHQQRYLDRPAMGDGNNVTAAVLDREAFDDRPHALDEIDETFATWRAFVSRPEPQRVGADPAFGIKGLALHALPDA